MSAPHIHLKSDGINLDERPVQPVALDLSMHTFSRTNGAILMLGSWVRHDGGYRACMVFLHRYTRAHLQDPYCLRRESAFLFSSDHTSDSNGDDRDPRSKRELIITEIIQRNPSLDQFLIADRIRVRSMIEDNLSDLLSMPPSLPRELGVLGEMTVRNRETGKVMEMEIKGHV